MRGSCINNLGKYDEFAKKEWKKFFVDFELTTGRLIAAMYKELALGPESKLRQALIDMGWAPPEDERELRSG